MRMFIDRCNIKNHIEESTVLCISFSKEDDERKPNRGNRRPDICEHGNKDTAAGVGGGSAGVSIAGILWVTGRPR